MVWFGKLPKNWNRKIVLKQIPKLMLLVCLLRQTKDSLKVMKALNEQGKPVKGAKILILGLAYKENVDDDRESPSYRLMGKLEDMGARVSYNDPYIPVIRPSREYAKYAGRKSQEIDNACDLILISTAHDEYRDIDFSALNIPVVDTRNVLKNKNPLFFKA